MANEAKQFTIGGVTHDVMDVGARQAIASLQNAIDAITSGDTTTAIKTFQEVINFLDGVTDDATLIGKLNELRMLINAKYAKPTSGIPASDLANGVIPDVSGFATKTEVNAKANDADVVKSVSVNGTAQTKDGNGNVNIEVEGGGLSKEDISVETQGDGTVDINVGSGANKDTYTINLNHTHENMAKLIVCEESDLPSTLDMDTIYAQVDDAGTPTVIQSLWIAGLEFVGGGGGVVDDTPRLNSPRTGNTIDFDGQSTASIVVKGKNLTSNLSVVVTGDFTVTTNGQSVSTIAAADVTDGASLTLTLTKGSTFDFRGGSLVISSSDLTEQVSVRVIDSQASPVPAGYTKLNSVRLVGNNPVNTNITATGTSWRVKVVGMFSGSAEVLISRGTSAKGGYFGILSSGMWGLTAGKEFSDISMGTEIEAIVSFSTSNTISVTIGDTTLTHEQTQNLGANNVLLFNTDNYPFIGYIHEVECTNGSLCHLYPAKRISDNEVGLYDVENDKFYTGFEESNI